MKTVKAIVLIFVSLTMLINPTADATYVNPEECKKMIAKVKKYLGKYFAFVMGANKDEGKLLAIPTCQKKPILIKSTTKNVFGEDAWVLEPDIWVQKEEKRSDRDPEIYPGYKICYRGQPQVSNCTSLIKIPFTQESRYNYSKNQTLEPKLVLINPISIWRHAD